MNNKKKGIKYPPKLQLKTENLESMISKPIETREWNEDIPDGMPNIFNRTAIFSGEKSKENKMYNKKEILSYTKNYNIYYTGPAMDKKDYQVFQLCCYSSKINNIKLGSPFRIFPSEWLKLLKRTDNKRSRDELHKSLEKLLSAKINVKHEFEHNNGNKYYDDISGNLLSLVRRISIKENDGKLERSNIKNDIKWIIAINPHIQSLFKNDLTWLDINKGAEIKSCLGLWLYDFYSSHHNPIPISTLRLKELSGSTMSNPHFNQSLKKNLEKLKEIGFLKSYFLDVKNKTEMFVIIEKEYLSPVYNVKTIIHKKNEQNNAIIL